MQKFACLLILFIFISCSKESQNLLCLKIKVIGYDYCSPATMGAQIIEGPHIGQAYGPYDNVISVHGADRNRILADSVLYVQVRDVNENENFIGICLDVYPGIVFSKIEKVLVSSSNQPCN